jgi:hypothetical protein
LYHIPESYRPKGKYLIYLYTNGILGHLSFLLNKKGPKTLAESYNMAIQIEKNLSSSRTNDRIMDTLSLIKLVSLETFAEDPQERREQVFYQQKEDVIKEKKTKQDDEVPTRAPPSDEVIQEPLSLAQQSEDEVSFFPLQDSDDTLFLDLENEGEMKALNEMDIPCCTIEDEEAIHEDETITHAKNVKVLEAPAQEETVTFPPPLVFDDALLYDEGNEEEENEFSNVSNPACYDTDSDIVDNIDEFIHVGRRRWDIVGYDLDPIYDTESHFQVFPLQLSQQITFDQWQQEDDIFTRTFQKTKDDLAPCFPDDFQSYLEIFYEYPSKHLDSLHEHDYQPPLCSDFDTSKNIVCLKKDSHDLSLQPPVITLPFFSIKGVVGKYIFYIEFPLKQTRESKGWLKTIDFSLSSQIFNLPLRICQSSDTSLSIPFQTSEYENVLGSQFSDPLSQCFEPWTFHDPFLKWIEYFPPRLTWHNFIPPTRLHELDFMIPDDLIHVLTRVIFVLGLSLGADTNSSP